jgi:deoxycytidylate deaminase
MIKEFDAVVAESTCQKRITICEIYDKDYNLLSRESNRCEPDNGICARLGVIQNKENYDVHSQCNWIHAEIRAVYSLPSESKPYLSILYGHDFYCDACEKTLKEAGVQKLEVNHLENPNHSPELKDLIKFLSDNGWRSKCSKPDEWQYERSYADMIYDEMWVDGDKVNVTYNDIQWGYTKYDHHEFTYQEFKDWCKSAYDY